MMRNSQTNSVIPPPPPPDEEAAPFGFQQMPDEINTNPQEAQPGSPVPKPGQIIKDLDDDPVVEYEKSGFYSMDARLNDTEKFTCRVHTKGLFGRQNFAVDKTRLISSQEGLTEEQKNKLNQVQKNVNLDKVNYISSPETEFKTGQRRNLHFELSSHHGVAQYKPLGTDPFKRRHHSSRKILHKFRA